MYAGTLRTSAKMGTVELTGLEMMRKQAFGQLLEHCSAMPLTMEALVLKRSSLGVRKWGHYSTHRVDKIRSGQIRSDQIRLDPHFMIQDFRGDKSLNDKICRRYTMYCRVGSVDTAPARMLAAWNIRLTTPLHNIS